MEHEQFLYDEFIEEAKEHLATIEDDFMALEGVDDPDPDLVDKVFRAVHSVKGGSAFLGLTNINELSHAMENLLSKIREGEYKPESEYIDALLEGVDMLSGMIDDVASSNDVDITDLHARLKAMVAGEAAPEKGSAARSPEPETVSAPAPAERPETPVDLEALDIGGLLEEFDFVYLLKYDLSSYEAHTPVGLFEELATAGEVKDAKLVLDDTDLSGGTPGPLRLDVVFATLVGDEYIDIITGLPEDRIHPLGELKAEPAHEPEGEAEVEAPAETVGDAQPEAKPEALSDAGRKSEAKSERSGSLRINVDILDRLMTLAGELVLVRNQQLMTMGRTDPAQRDIIQRLDVVTTEMQETVMRTRMQPIDIAFSKLPRIVRDLSKKLGKKIDLQIEGNEVELDKTIIESLTDPLTHIIRNCCDHGIETPDEREAAGKPRHGVVKVRAYHEGGQINIEFEDDGRGIDPEKIKSKVLEKGLKNEAELAQMTDKEIISLIMLPGFSTAGQVSDVSGRGVGMDVVRYGIEELGGSVDMDSRPGKGTMLHLRLPLTLAIIPCLIATVNGNRFAIPQVNLEELVCLYDRDVFTRIEHAGNQEVFRLRDRLLPLVRLGEVLERHEPFVRETKAEVCKKYRAMREEMLLMEVNEQGGDEASAEDEQDRGVNGFISVDPRFQGSLHFAVVKVGAERFGLIVDNVLGTEEIVVKPMHSSLKPLRIYSGATVMGDGGVALILDIEGIARHARVFSDQRMEEPVVGEQAVAQQHKESQYVLIFKAGGRERFALALPLIRRIEKISTEDVERVGDKEFITVEDESTLVLRMDRFLSVEAGEDDDEMYLILPKFSKRPFGILMSEIVDIVDAAVELNTESHMEDGLLGTDIIDERMTLFPDIYRLIALAEPEWFKNGREHEDERGMGVRVLLAEDSPFLQHMIKAYLTAVGYDVEAANNGAEALQKYRAGTFDLIVSDLEMPVMDGFTFISEVRSMEDGHVPAMALTSLNTEEDRRRALNAGFDDFQVKIDRGKFLSQAARLTAEKRGEPADVD